MKTRRDLILEIDATAVSHGKAAFWWLGQHGFVVKTASSVLYLDPFLSPMADRLVNPLLTPDEATNATLITGSHDHGDHIDHPALLGMMCAAPRAQLVVPCVAVPALISEGLPSDRVHGIGAGETMRFDDVTVHAVAAAHELLDYNEHTGYPYLGFVLEADGITIYHAGDTCVYEGLVTALKKWDITVAFLPINGRDARRLRNGCIGNMTYQEAVDLAGAIRPVLTVPAHFEMFAMNSQDPSAFCEYMDVKFPGLTYRVPEHGVCIRI